MSRLRNKLWAIALTMTMAGTVPAIESETLSNTWSRTKSEAHRLAVLGEIKASLLDHKDIKSRYIRVHFNGQTLEIAGFAPDTNTTAAVERIAKTIAAPEATKVFWSVTDGLQAGEPYATYVEERAADLGVWAKVKASLASPHVRALLKHADVQAVDVNHGAVVVYLIADAPPIDIDLATHVTGISGVKSYKCQVLRAY